MTDNSDILGGDPAPILGADAPKRRGRPPKAKPESPKFDEVANAPVVPASTSVDLDALTDPPVTFDPSTLLDVDVETMAPEGVKLADPEPADPHSYALPPVSPAYAKAQAERVQIIGQSKKEYAYQRLLRAGKKL